MRAFVAAVPSDTAIDHLDEFLDIRREVGGFRWAPPEQFHVTLAFAASVPDRCYDDWLARLERAARKRAAFTTAIAGGGAFPHVADAKVLWAGLALDDDAATEMSRLATGARAATSKAGIDTDGRRFHPHVTVARLSYPDEVSNWVRLLDAYEGPSWTVDRISLIQSHLGEGPRGRPRYEVREEFPLADAQAVSPPGSP